MSADTSKSKSQWLIIRETVSRHSKIILGTIPILIILTIWQICTTGSPESRIISPLILPSPLEVISPAKFHAAGSEAELNRSHVSSEAELNRSFVASTIRVVLGFLILGGIAFPVAIMMGLFSKVNALANTSKSKSQWLVIRETVNKSTKIILGAIPILLILTVWQICTTGTAENRIISPLILPSPLEVISPATFHAVWFEAELSRSIVASTTRVVLGFIIGCAIAFPLAIGMGSFSKINALFEPGTLFLSYLPIPALVPLTMSLFGIGETQKMMFLALAFLIYMIPLFVKAINEVDNVYLQTAYTLGVKRWKMVHKVLVPIALPQIYQAMRMGFGVGWTYIILAEMVAADRGLGQIIIIAQRRANVSRIYLVLLVIVIIAFLTDKIWEYGYKQFFPYKRAR